MTPNQYQITTIYLIILKIQSQLIRLKLRSNLIRPKIQSQLNNLKIKSNLINLKIQSKLIHQKQISRSTNSNRSKSRNQPTEKSTIILPFPRQFKSNGK